MKIICNCGNEAEFDTKDIETGEERERVEYEGQYATVEGFRFWETHDVVGVVCEKCGKDVWLFT